MAGITKTTDTTQAYQFQTFFSKQLLVQILKSLVLAEFALKSPLPSVSGAKSMRMYRMATPSTANVVATTEGVVMAAASYKQLILEYIDVTLLQYIQTIAITDVLEATALISMLKQATEQNGNDAALNCDTIVRNELKQYTGTVGNVNYATANFIYAQAAGAYATVYNGGTQSASFALTDVDILDGVTALKKQNAPKIGGSYILACSPVISRDVMKGATGATVFQEVSKYSAATQIFNGEIGKLWGARVVETTNPFTSAATQGTLDETATGIVYDSFLFGKGAYGISDLSSLGSAMAPKMYMVKGADKADPADQLTLASFKTFFAAKLLQPLWFAHLYSQTGYGL